MAPDRLILKALNDNPYNNNLLIINHTKDESPHPLYLSNAVDFNPTLPLFSWLTHQHNKNSNEYESLLLLLQLAVPWMAKPFHTNILGLS